MRIRLTATETSTAAAKQRHESELAAERTRYELLSKQLLRETAYQRETFQTERQRIKAELARAAEHLAALESLLKRLLMDLSQERETRQHAAAEAAALITLVEQQRHMLARVGAGSVNGRATRPLRGQPPTARPEQLSPPRTPTRKAR